MPPPPTALFNPLIRPFWPPVDVDWDIWTLADIHESSPWVDTIDSPDSRTISNSGMVVPLTSACMLVSLGPGALTRCSLRLPILPATAGRDRDTFAGPGRRSLVA